MSINPQSWVDTTAKQRLPSNSNEKLLWQLACGCHQAISKQVQKEYTPGQRKIKLWDCKPT
jgi:hypothetical protein